MFALNITALVLNALALLAVGVLFWILAGSKRLF
jgi:hypothetical protein